MTRAFSLVVIPALLVINLACAVGCADRVTGSGVIKSEPREVAGFKEVRLRGSGDQGSSQGTTFVSLTQIGFSIPCWRIMSRKRAGISNRARGSFSRRRFGRRRMRGGCWWR